LEKKRASRLGGGNRGREEEWKGTRFRVLDGQNEKPEPNKLKKKDGN